MSETSNGPEGLSADERRALLAEILQKKSDQSVLSFAQERLWVLNELEPDSPAYAVQAAVRVTGPLDVDALRRSLDEVVRRHDVLRATFVERDGQPVQAVGAPFSLDVEITDLAEIAPDEQREPLQQLAAAESRRPFVLGVGPLVRAGLARLGAAEHVLLLTLHHAVSDAWSMDVFVRELASIYGAFAGGSPSPLPELPMQYADFAVRQRERAGEVEEEQVAFWRERFGAGAPVLQLPTDRPRPAMQTYDGSCVSAGLPSEVGPGLEEIANAQGTDLFTALLAGFAALLSRYSGQEDVVVGTFVPNRDRPETEGLIGFVKNALALRMDLSGDPTFLELIGRVRETCDAAYANQDVPFEKLLDELQPERDLSRSPLFQTTFTLEQAPSAQEAAGVIFERMDVHPGTSLFDLGVSVVRDGDEVTAAFEFNTTLFEDGTVSRLAGHFGTLLAAAVADPGRRVSELPLLSAEEERQLVVQWNDSARAFATGERCLHDAFTERARANGERLALIADGRRFSYAELNGRANRLAHVLVERGVGPEVAVAICAERSPEAIVAMLAVMKAGGAYVPLDPAHPKERLAFVLSDAAAPVLLTQEHLAERLPEHEADTILLDRDWDDIATRSDQDPETECKPDHLAYVIYTSGSTGRPKGVLGLHRGAVNCVSWLQEAYPFAEDDVAVQRTSLTFVDAVWEIFGPLLAGVQLVIAPDDVVKDPERLVALLEEHAVTRMVVVPSLLRAILHAEIDLEVRLARLRYCFSSGEALPVELARRFAERVPGARLVNVYGTSEVSADATAYDVEGDAVGATVPIGRPIANMHVYVLDRHLRPVPVGVQGEICVGGVGLARGYLNRADLTAAKFVTSPFDGNGRLYRTGDLGRFLPDGNIEYLGRADHQVKIRGFRIELGEIETVLVEHPAIREAVVVARDEGGPEQRLVAYVVPPEGQEPAIADLRAHLGEQLPDYMLPAAFVVLDALPLTVTGKVDRLSLPEPDHARPDLLQPYVEPESPAEKELAALFGEVLHIELVGLDDDFFELGGNSLRVIELLAKLRDRFQVDFPMRVLYETSTVKALAAAIESIRHSGVQAAPTAVDSPIDFEAEAILDPSIRPGEAEPWDPTVEAKNIFLTGGTGFLGVHLLHELLQQTDANIYCLVRAPSVEKGKLRLKEKLEESFHWDPLHSARIIPVLGDLTSPRFGLTPERFDELARVVDAIYHSGAYVNFVFPYSALKASNVFGTHEAIRLAARIKLKPLHHISLTDVALHLDEDGVWVIDEGPADVYPRGIFMSGYAQTKWVAERLVSKAQERGLPATIYRPGFIEGNSETGYCNKSSELCLTLKGCIALGTAPNHDMMFDCAPVDYASKAFVYLSRKPDSIGRIFGAVCPWPVHIRSVIDWVSEAGYPLKRLPYEEWREQVLEEVAGHPEHPLYPLLPYSVDEEIARMPLAFPCDCTNTLTGLEGSGVKCPPIDAKLMRTCLTYLQNVGFLEPTERPPAEAQPATTG